MLRKLLNLLAGLFILVLIATAWVQRGPLSQFIGGGNVISDPLMVGTNVWSGYEPLYLARDLGHYGKAVHLVEYSSATEVIRALRNKLIDVGALTLDEVLLLRQHGIDVRIVLVTDVSDGGDVILAKPEIETLADLRGRTVAVESTALGAYVLTQALKTIGLTPADVKVEHVEVDGHYAAYMGNKADAVVTFEPVRSQLLKEGGRLVFDSSQMPGKIVDVLVTWDDIMTEKEPQMQTLIAGWFSALTYLSDKPEDASQRMAARMNFTPKEVINSFDGLKFPDRAENRAMLDDAHASSLTRTARQLAEVMSQTNLLNGEADLTGLLDPRFLQVSTP